MRDDPLALLRDIHLPPDPGWWPPAPGWWLALLAAAAACTLLAPAARRFSARVRARGAALRALAAIEQRRRDGASAQALAADLSVLLRRVALSRHPAATVAGLSGQRWLDFLDRGIDGGGFADGPGRSLLSAPYGGAAPQDLAALLTLARRWIRRNAGPRSDA